MTIGVILNELNYFYYFYQKFLLQIHLFNFISQIQIYSIFLSNMNVSRFKIFKHVMMLAIKKSFALKEYESLNKNTGIRFDLKNLHIRNFAKGWKPNRSKLEHTR